jgi:Ca2+-binding RTX toxin-like protein
MSHQLEENLATTIGGLCKDDTSTKPPLVGPVATTPPGAFGNETVHGNGNNILTANDTVFVIGGLCKDDTSAKPPLVGPVATAPPDAFGNDTVNYTVNDTVNKIKTKRLSSFMIGGLCKDDTTAKPPLVGPVATAPPDTFGKEAVHGNDTLIASLGNDTLDGGSGSDTANYNALGTDSLIGIETIIGSSLLGDTVDHSGASVAPATGTVTNLTTGVVTVNGTAAPLPLTFNVSQFENVIGSGFADTITGNAASNSLSGGAGNDAISGGAGNDIINGEAGTDTAAYLDATAAVTVSLSSGTSSGGAGSDTLIDIENVIGSIFADTISGNNNANNLSGDAGDDTLIASAGNDALTGGSGSDTLLAIENLSGSSFADTISGNSNANNLSGDAGDDTLIASAGNDTLDGGSGSDTANYNALGSVVTLGAFGVLRKGALGTDSLIGIETIIGSSLLGDTVDHSGASVAPATGTVTNLTTGVVTVNGTAAPLPLTFNVSQFENVIGSGFADTITGNAASNSLVGGAGNDTLTLNGNDTLIGTCKANNIAKKTKTKILSSLVFRLNRADRHLIDGLSSDYAESIVTIVGKSLRLYRAIVEAVEQGGSLIMIRTPSLSGPRPRIDSSDAYETVIAVREQFADKGKTPIALNRAYIDVSKGLKTERIALRVTPAVAHGLEELECKTGLSKSTILRDSTHLYNFVKREFEGVNTSFCIGDLIVDGI